MQLIPLVVPYSGSLLRFVNVHAFLDVRGLFIEELCLYFANGVGHAGLCDTFALLFVRGCAVGAAQSLEGVLYTCDFCCGLQSFLHSLSCLPIPGVLQRASDRVIRGHIHDLAYRRGGALSHPDFVWEYS